MQYICTGALDKKAPILNVYKAVPLDTVPSGKMINFGIVGYFSIISTLSLILFSFKSDFAPRRTNKV
jgi:hypothetical protein